MQKYTELNLFLKTRTTDGDMFFTILTIGAELRRSLPARLNAIFCL